MDAITRTNKNAKRKSEKEDQKRESHGDRKALEMLFVNRRINLYTIIRLCWIQIIDEFGSMSLVTPNTRNSH